MYTARSVRAKNDQEIWSGDLIRSVRGNTVGTPRRGQPSGGSDARRTTQANDRMEHEHKNPSEHSGRKWARLQDVRHVLAQEERQHSVVCLNRQGELKNKTIPQSEHMTHTDDTEGQQITHEASSSSTVRTPSTPRTDNRDTDKQGSNDDSENPGEWTPAKRIRMKSKTLTQPKRPREMPTVLEKHGK